MEFPSDPNFYDFHIFYGITEVEPYKVVPYDIVTTTRVKPVWKGKPNKFYAVAIGKFEPATENNEENILLLYMQYNISPNFVFGNSADGILVDNRNLRRIAKSDAIFYAILLEQDVPIGTHHVTALGIVPSTFIKFGRIDYETINSLGMKIVSAIPFLILDWKKINLA